MLAAIDHGTRVLGIPTWASNDPGIDPEVVVARCDDVPAKRALAAAALLRRQFPKLRVRCPGPRVQTLSSTSGVCVPATSVMRVRLASGAAGAVPSGSSGRTL